MGSSINHTPVCLFSLDLLNKLKNEGGGGVEIKAGEDQNISFTADKACDERCGLGKQKQWASWYQTPEKSLFTSHTSTGLLQAFP